jgi:DNA-binding transcriptional regulator of glucitol operon
LVVWTEFSFSFLSPSFFLTMRFTKTAEELQERRAKVSKWTRNGEVMTDAMRKRIRDEQKRLQELQDKADMILAGLNTNTKPKRQTQTVNAPVIDNGSVRNLSRETKSDELALKASQILKEILQ